jgi:hypothetical protein
MGLKIMKFHGIVHMVDDIINFGVPMNYDTGSDESGHKPAKAAAKVMQKREEYFDEQVGSRLAEVKALDLAVKEIDEGQRPWKYSGQSAQTAEETGTDGLKSSYAPHGGRYVIICDELGAKTLQKLDQRSKDTAEVVRIEQSYVDFIADLCQNVEGFIPNLEVRTMIWLNGVLYCGSPMYRGEPWRDWVIVDWGDDGYLPAKIWGFVNLETLPQNNKIVCGGLSGIPPSVYAIVESAVQDCSGSGSGTKSEIFLGITKEVGGMQHNHVTKLKFYLADVDAFHEPVVVIPDMGSRLPTNRYLMLRNMTKWKEDFTKWLDAPYKTY